MHSKPYMHVTGSKLEGVEVVPDHVMAQEAVYALQVMESLLYCDSAMHHNPVLMLKLLHCIRLLCYVHACSPASTLIFPGNGGTCI